MQLRMPLFEVVQKGFGFPSGQETQSFIIGFYHFPSTALGGQQVDSAPHSGGDSTVYGGTHERKDVVQGLPGQSFPGGRLQELRLEAGKQIRSQFDNGQSVNFVLEVGVMTVVPVNVFPFTSAPCKIGIHQVPDGNFIPLNGVDASDIKLGKELCPLLSGS